MDLPSPEIAVVPLFGQDNGDGTFVAFQPDEKLISELAKVVAGDIIVKAISRSDIVPGSEAEKLFILGQAQPAPAGRFDDFSYTKPVQ